jgi:hypothetical protein
MITLLGIQNKAAYSCVTDVINCVPWDMHFFQETYKNRPIYIIVTRDSVAQWLSTGVFWLPHFPTPAPQL